MKYAPGVHAKLFLALLLTGILLIAAMMLGARFSFHHGFLNYMHEVEAERIETLSGVLERYYAEEGDWDNLRHNRRKWAELLRRAALKSREDNEHPRAQEPPIWTPRLIVLDAQRRPVIGNAPPDAPLRLHPLHEGERTIGWLGHQPPQGLTDALALRFHAEQSRMFWGIALIALLMAFIAAAVLARRLLRPVDALARGTRALTAGDYTTRVQVDTRDEFHRLAEDFNTLAQTLERTDQARRQWVADISHELRTPLSVLKGEIEALEDGVRPLDARALVSLRSEVNTLTTLVEDLYQLALSDIGALNCHKSPVPIGELLAATAAAFGERLREAGLRLHIDCAEAPTLHADRARLMQLFGNLLENSLRYTDSGGEVRLLCAQEDGHLQIDIDDSAPGVPPEALPRLFERLYRVEGSRNRRHGGAGLGLSICRAIVEAHGGRIEARPTPLGGLRIHIELPLNA
ncbi:MAG: ATP-binding protein [Pseudomonadota bacterium]